MDGDGNMDLVLHFIEGELGLPTVDVYEDKEIVELTLTAELLNGQTFTGHDDVRINPNDAKSQGNGGKGPKNK